MSVDDNSSDLNEKNIADRRKARKYILSHLSGYKKGYNGKRFISDLVKYFDDEIDFNLDKVRDEIEQPGKLDQLIQKADQHNTHPVVEFVQNIFKGLTS